MLRSSSIRHPPFYLEFSILLCRFNNSRCNLLICRHLVFVYTALPTVIISLTQSHKLASENLFLTYILVDLSLYALISSVPMKEFCFHSPSFGTLVLPLLLSEEDLAPRQPPPSIVLRIDHFEDCNICNFKKNYRWITFFSFLQDCLKNVFVLLFFLTTLGQFIQ